MREERRLRRQQHVHIDSREAIIKKKAMDPRVEADALPLLCAEGSRRHANGESVKGCSVVKRGNGRGSVCGTFGGWKGRSGKKEEV